MSETIITKTCPQCKNTKLLSDFYKSKSTLDGHHGWCKLCFKQAVKSYSQTPRGRLLHNINSRRSYQKPETKEAKRKYQQSAKARAYQKKYREENKIKKEAYQKEYRKTGRGKTSLNKGYRNYRLNHPEKRRAKNAVDNKVSKGLMPAASSLSCVECRNQAAEYHHWHGYEPEFWLDVIPVCRNCHRTIHKELRDSELTTRS